MEKKKVQMGSTYLYSGCRKRGRQTSVHHLTPQLPFSPQPSTVGERGSLCWVGMSLTLALPPNFLLFISHLQEQTGPFPPLLLKKRRHGQSKKAS